MNTVCKITRKFTSAKSCEYFSTKDSEVLSGVPKTVHLNRKSNVASIACEAKR